MIVLHFFKNYFSHLNKNVLFLSVAQVFFMTSANINMISSGLAGFIVAPYAWLSTLPLSFLFIVSMLGTIPVSLLMSKFGRKPIFFIGSVLTSLAGFLMGLSLIYNYFILLCFGSMLLGLGHSIASFYRYAATETVSEKVKPKAMSLVISAGLIAAFLGPEISKLTAKNFDNYFYAASFFAISILHLISMPFILSLKIPVPKKNNLGGRSIFSIIFKYGMIKAIISAAAGYSIMTYLMTATPLQIVNVCNFGLSTNALIIQWHVVAMFAPSFITGTLIQKYEAEKVIFFGIMAYVCMIIFSLIATTPIYYLLSLIFLGIGWNFLFLGGSSLIVKYTKPEEKGKVQGIADFIIFSSVAFGSLSAGFLHYNIGWEKMVLVIIPIIILLIIINLIYLNKEERDIY